MKKLIFAAIAILLTFGAGAQNTNKKNSTAKSGDTFVAAAQNTTKKIYNPKAGDFAIGITFNPLGIQNHTYQPEKESFAGAFVSGLGSTPKQMFILATDPMISFMINYHFTEVVSLRANIGLSGSVVNYKEYVINDAAYLANNKVGLWYDEKTFDVATSKLNGTTIGLGLEFTKAFGRLAFVGGFGLQYAVGGGSLSFKYGNPLTKAIMEDNLTTLPNGPHTMNYMALTGDGSLNEWEKVKDLANKYGQELTPKETYSYGRPKERYNVGMNHGIGITADMGLEYFFAGRMSLSAAVTFTPIMVVFQPQTRTTYEVWDSTNHKVSEFPEAMVSPGSTALLYGTQNIGLRLAFKYYL